MSKVRIYKAIFGVSIAMYIIGTLFRIMHWPFGLIICTVGLVSIAISSSLFYSAKLEKSFVEELAIVLVPLFCGFMLLRLLHLPYQLEIRIGLMSIAILYILYKGVQWQRVDKADGKQGINW